jgi:hypothetical protein
MSQSGRFRFLLRFESVIQEHGMTGAADKEGEMGQLIGLIMID